jgi:hypothetical protein
MNVRDADQFREELPESGLFDLYDCTVLVEAAPSTPVSEIETISTLIHSAINVVDFKTAKLGETFDQEIRISIAEVPLHVAEKRNPRGPRS